MTDPTETTAADALTVYTIGHSTRPLDELVDLLREYDITLLADVRSVPGSRHNPQYGQHALEESLPERGITYRHLKTLGGLRHTRAEDDAHSPNKAWRNASFRHYADYMGTDAFAHGIDDLLALAAEQPTVIMCAEAVPWRCHRSMIGDALVVRGVRVLDIMGPGKVTPHKLTSFAHVDGTHITYPPTEDTP